MADTYTRILIHAVIVVKGRENLISQQWQDELYKYINGIIKNIDQKLMIINGMPDHVHLLLGIKPTMAVSDLLRDIKANSSRFINEKKWIRGRFEWQQGYGAFSCNPCDLDNIINYIKTQEEHHKKRPFRAEYMDILDQNSIDYKNEYLFDDI